MSVHPEPVQADPYQLHVRLSPDAARRELLVEARVGLTSRPRELSPRWLYDARGSALFERITRLPEYYPTRREREILHARAAALARLTGAATLCELGSGSSEKTELLLGALERAGGLSVYAALDVSARSLERALGRIHRRHPGLALVGIVGDFEHDVALLEGPGPRLFVFLGGTVGNLKPRARARFFRQVRAAMHPLDRLLLGADLLKPRTRLHAAYDDASGVTAAFNRNVLCVLNRELGADFVPSAFRHEVRFDEREQWVEMWLVPDTAQRVHVPALDLTLRLQPGEAIRTEVSTKFEPSRLQGELVRAGLEEEAFWTDAAGDFSLSLWRRARRGRRRPH